MHRHDHLPIVGIDVAKRSLDFFADRVNGVAPGFARSFSNDDDGIAKLLAELRRINAQLVVVEATGRYHRRIAALLLDADIAVAVANPTQTRAHATARGRLEKTDRIDAELLADFGRCLDPRTVRDPSEISSEMRDLVSRRRALVQTLVAEKNRAHDALPKLAREQSIALRQLLKQQIEDLDREIAKQIDADQDSDAARASRIVDSVPGIGPDSANQLVVTVPELGSLNREQIAKLVGVAPLNCDSGPRRGQRHIRGGRADARPILYMMAHNARLYCDRFRNYFKGLIARGKPHQVAMTALMRKLLVTLNQMIKTSTPWTVQTA
jgi:transposase